MDHLVVDSKSQRLFLANKVNNTLDIVDLKAGKLHPAIPGQAGVQGIAYASDLDRIYVALGTGGFCNIFDGKDYKLLKTVKFADDADNVRYNPRTSRVYVAHAESSLGVIDAKTFELKTDIKLPGAAEAFQLETGRPAALPECSLNHPRSSLSTPTKTRSCTAIRSSWPARIRPWPLDEANHRLFIGCRAKPMVVVMDTETGKEIDSVPIAGDIDDVFFDAKRERIYASCGEGFLAVIRQLDADHYESLDKISDLEGCADFVLRRRNGQALPGSASAAGQKWPGDSCVSGPVRWIIQHPISISPIRPIGLMRIWLAICSIRPFDHVDRNRTVKRST